MAKQPIPPSKYYGNFNQLDDGVGSIRMLLDDFKELKLPKSVSRHLKAAFATSYAAKDALEEIAKELNKIDNFEALVCPVKSAYWGRDITVAGLITTDDLIRTVKDIEADIVIIPSVMLKQYSEDFLDGRDLNYVKQKTGKDFLVVQNIYSISEIVDYLNTFA